MSVQPAGSGDPVFRPHILPNLVTLTNFTEMHKGKAFRERRTWGQGRQESVPPEQEVGSWDGGYGWRGARMPIALNGDGEV